MSDIGLSYDAKTQPSNVGVRFGLSFADTTLKATVDDIDNFSVSLTPSGNVSEEILSGVAWPLAQSLSTMLPPLVRALMTGFTFNVLTVSAATTSIAGEPITVKPAGLSLSNQNGILVVQGAIDVS